MYNAALSKTPFTTIYIKLPSSWLPFLFPINAILSLSLSLYLVLIEIPSAVENSAFVAVNLKNADDVSPMSLLHSQMTASSSSISNVSISISIVPPFSAQSLIIGFILKST